MSLFNGRRTRCRCSTLALPSLCSHLIQRGCPRLLFCGSLFRCEKVSNGGGFLSPSFVFFPFVPFLTSLQLHQFVVHLLNRGVGFRITILRVETCLLLVFGSNVFGDDLLFVERVLALRFVRRGVVDHFDVGVEKVGHLCVCNWSGKLGKQFSFSPIPMSGSLACARVSASHVGRVCVGWVFPPKKIICNVVVVLLFLCYYTGGVLIIPLW